MSNPPQQLAVVTNTSHSHYELCHCTALSSEILTINTNLCTSGHNKMSQEGSLEQSQDEYDYITLML